MDKENRKSYIINPKSPFGFSLIELILAVSIFLLIGTFTTNFYTRFLTQNSVSNTQDQFLGSLRKAQMYAMIGKAGSNWGVHYDSGTREITLYSGTAWAGHNSAYDENYSVNPNVSITPSPFTDVIFTRLTGIPNFSSTLTLNIIGNSDSKIIDINVQGVATRRNN